MLIEYRLENDVCIMTINGDITLGGINELEEDIKPFLKDNAVKGIALNLANVDLLDSSGIRVLLLSFPCSRR